MASPRWTRENLRHVRALFWQGRYPAATVYDSIGEDFFLAPAPGWLNLGYWEGPGSEAEAPLAVRRLVERLAGHLPKGGVVLDVGNGLAAQDPVIAEVARPRALLALNITLSQLRAGEPALLEAGALAIQGDAVHIPLAGSSLDGVISVEAAFHFSSRATFLSEAKRVLRPGGVLTFSDVPAERMPRGPLELYAGMGQLRVWGLRAGAARSTRDIVRMVEAAGFYDVRVELCGDRVIDPAHRLISDRLYRSDDVPFTQRLACRAMLQQIALLRRRGMIDYLLLRAVAA